MYELQSVTGVDMYELQSVTYMDISTCILQSVSYNTWTCMFNNQGVK